MWCTDKHLGQITPRCSRAQYPEDAIEDTTVVHPRNATRLVRQHGLDGNPFIIGEFVAHDSSPQFGSLITGVWPDATLPGRPRLDAYGVEADISQPTISAETVENDPIRTYRNRKALNLDGTEGLRRAPRPMKMGTTACRGAMIHRPADAIRPDDLR